MTTTEPPPPPSPSPAVQQADVAPVDVFALPAATSSLMELRVPASLQSPSGYVELFSSVADAAAATMSDDAAMTAFVAANRDLLDYRFQYKLTAQGLAASNLGDEAGAAERTALRDAVVKACLRFDAALFREVGLAEQRLGQLLGVMLSEEQLETSQIVAAAGSAPQQQLAFWLVTSAAIGAWESKLEVPSIAAQAQQKLVDLGVVRDALEADALFLTSAGIEFIAPLVRGQLSHPIDHARFGSNAAIAVSEMPALDTEARTSLLRKIGCMREQCTRHAYQVICEPRPSLRNAAP